MLKYDLSRFSTAHRKDYTTALTEIKNGRKTSHWMWYIFPQLKGLGRSPMSDYYGIANIEEARDFLADTYLGANLREISGALLQLESNDATYIMGRPDDWKLKSSMTLFCVASEEIDNVFFEVLEKFFQGKKDSRTLKMLEKK